VRPPCSHHSDAHRGIAGPYRPWLISCRVTRPAVGNGIGAPGNMPADIVEKLNQEISAQLTAPKMIAQLADIGALPMPMTTGEFGKFIATETREMGPRWSSFAGINPQ